MLMSVTMVSRRRWYVSLRFLALGLLVCMLMARPVLAAMGEAHELAHDPSGQHSHVEEGTPVTEDAPEERSVTHALLHYAHCCGQSPPVLASAVVVPAALPPALPALGVVSRPAASDTRVSPFRPPIRA